MSLIASDPDVCVFDTEPGKSMGANAIEALLAGDWSQHEDSSYEINWINIYAAGVVAWLVSEVHFKVRSKGHNIIFPCCVTAVLEKRKDKWLIMQGHFSTPEMNDIQV